MVDINQVGHKFNCFILASYPKQVLYTKYQVDPTKSIVCSVGQRVNKSICFDRSVDTMIHWPLSKEFPSPKMDIDREDVIIYNGPDCYNVLVDDAW